MSAIDELCPSCGLCCNGVIFGDVELQAKDDAKHLAALAGAQSASARYIAAHRLRPGSGQGASRTAIAAAEGLDWRNLL